MDSNQVRREVNDLRIMSLSYRIVSLRNEIAALNTLSGADSDGQRAVILAQAAKQLELNAARAEAYALLSGPRSNVDRLTMSDLLGV